MTPSSSCSVFVGTVGPILGWQAYDRSKCGLSSAPDVKRHVFWSVDLSSRRNEMTGENWARPGGDTHPGIFERLYVWRLVPHFLALGVDWHFGRRRRQRQRRTGRRDTT